MTTPTTQREADERAAFEKHLGPRTEFAWRNQDGTYKVYALQSAWEIWQARAATDQPSAGQVDERALYDDWWHEGAHPFRDISKRKNCQLNEETAWMVWQAARASLTPTAPADGTTQHRNIAAALKGLANHVRACSEYRRLDGDMEFVDQAIIALESAPTAPQAASQQAETFCDANCVWTDHHPECKIAASQAATTASAGGEISAWMSEDGRVCTDKTKRSAMHARTAESYSIPLCRAALAAPVQAAQPALPSEKLDPNQVQGITERIRNTVGLAAPGAAQTTVAREGGAK